MNLPSLMPLRSQRIHKKKVLNNTCVAQKRMRKMVRCKVETTKMGNHLFGVVTQFSCDTTVRRAKRASA